MAALVSINARLDAWRQRIKAEFLVRQQHPSALLPASTASTVHGDYSHAWVRDNVYSILAAWALSRAYRRHIGTSDEGRALEESVCALMRGLLHAMGAQADKIEAFKRSEDPLDALHAKYDAATGATVVNDDGWGHLQLDATALFLLYCAQMSKGGLAIVQTEEEAAIVQNLIFYIGPAYRVADYGIWERGQKSNRGVREINASSVGMAKAALESMGGLTVTLANGRHVTFRAPPDEVVRCRETLTAMLPAESASKETDAALLSVVGFPAFAVEDALLAERTRARVLDRLEGRYGCKRFLRDGHQTHAEDTSRLHYEVGELERFENLEAEWPLFWAFLAVDAAMKSDGEAARRFLRKLSQVAVEREGRPCLPELYTVAPEHEAAEAAFPGSQARLSNDNCPLYWAQSLWMTAELLSDGLVLPEDLDPCGRRLRLGARVGAAVQVSIVGDGAANRYANRPFGAAILGEAAARAVCDVAPAPRLAQMLAQCGAWPPLGLSGRPQRRLGAVITSQIYEQDGRALAFTPSSLDSDHSYLRFDAAAFAERIRADIAYVARHWIEAAPATIVVAVPDDVFDGAGAAGFDALVEEIAGGRVGAAATTLTALREAVQGQRVALDDLPRPKRTGAPAIPTARIVPIWSEFAERTPFDPKDEGAVFDLLATTHHPDDMATALAAARQLGALDRTVAGRGSARDMAMGLYDAAGRRQAWRIVRMMAVAGQVVDERLADMLKELVVRLRRISLGPASTIDAPMTGPVLRARLSAMVGLDSVRIALAEEAVLHLGALIKAEPQLFAGCRTVRLWDWLDQAEHDLSQSGVAIADAAPSAIAATLRSVASNTPSARAILALGQARFAQEHTDWSWAAWRARLGVMTRVHEDFYDRLWRLLGCCDGLTLGDASAPGARIDARIVRSDHTSRERQFAELIEDALTRIASPAYRALTLEAINAAAIASETDPHFKVAGDLSCDAMIAGAGEALHPDPSTALAQMVQCSAFEMVERLGGAALSLRQ
jgi:phosphorylase kinase alpha/beta subunit